MAYFPIFIDIENVKVLVIKGFKLPFYYYVFAFRPILVGILPMWLYKLLHKKKLRLN